MYLTVAEFDTVSYPQFTADVKKCNPLISEGCIEDMWRDLVFPDRATEGSAGYDFRVPYDIILEPGESALIPTGMRCQIEEGWVLLIFPRSSMGFKYRMQLDNGTGVIDSDYYYAENEGHIMAKITNDSREGKTMHLRAGDRFMQGVFVPYGVTVDDEPRGEENRRSWFHWQLKRDAELPSRRLSGSQLLVAKELSLNPEPCASRSDADYELNYH